MTHGAKWKAALLLALVLASGIGLGIVIDRAFLARRGALPPGEFMSPWRMGRVLARLDLTPEQRAQVDSILAVRRGDLARMREDVRPELDRIRIATETDLRAILTPEQVARFDRHLERIRRFGQPGRGPDRDLAPPGPGWRHRGGGRPGSRGGQGGPAEPAPPPPAGGG